MVTKNVNETFHDAPESLVERLRHLGRQGMFTLWSPLRTFSGCEQRETWGEIAKLKIGF